MQDTQTQCLIARCPQSVLTCWAPAPMIVQSRSLLPQCPLSHIVVILGSFGGVVLDLECAGYEFAEVALWSRRPDYLQVPPMSCLLLFTVTILCSCSWSPDARMIAASTIAGIILIFEVESGRELVRYGYHKKVSQWLICAHSGAESARTGLLWGRMESKAV